MKLTLRKRFGLICAAIGAFTLAIATFANTLNNPTIFSSISLIILGAILWFINLKESSSKKETNKNKSN